MKHTFSLIYFFSIIFLFFSQIHPEIVTTPIKIKVLLDECSTEKKHKFHVKTKEKLFAKIEGCPKAKTYRLKKPQIEICATNNALYARSGSNPPAEKAGPFRRIKSNELYLKSSHPITVNNKQYSGIIAFKLIPKKKKLYLINKLDLEDYVYAVLLAEIYTSWPDEMQQIQAIVSRTYAVKQMLVQKNKKKNKKPYDIKRTTFHQRYNGNHENHDYYNLRRAVNKTNGQVLTYRNKIALTMFDACCGGSIPAFMTGIDFEKEPQLARTTPCKYCKNYGLYRWKRKIPCKKFLKSLGKNGKITDINITKKDNAGVVHKVQISQGQNKKFTVSGKKIWNSMSKIVRSKNFTIKKDNNHILINGKGFGHQIGLCQRGARELVRRNKNNNGLWPIKKILEFYYPNTTLARLRVKKEKKHGRI